MWLSRDTRLLARPTRPFTHWVDKYTRKSHGELDRLPSASTQPAVTSGRQERHTCYILVNAWKSTTQNYHIYLQ